MLGSNRIEKAYQEFCNHYFIEPTRNNKGVSHENGSIEVSHRHMRRRVDQALMIRGSRDFVSLDDYRNFVDSIVARHNQGILDLLKEERKSLRPLPETKTRDYDVEFVLWTTSTLITVRQVGYSVPSRLIGMQLKVHLFDHKLECYLGTTAVVILTRLRSGKGPRPHVINYLHLIDSLSKKPQAFRHYIFRNELYPTDAFRAAWDILDKELDERKACKTYVGILKLASETSEEAVSKLIMVSIGEGKIPQLAEMQARLSKQNHYQVHVEIESRDLKSYESLLTQSGELYGS